MKNNLNRNKRNLKQRRNGSRRGNLRTLTIGTTSSNVIMKRETEFEIMRQMPHIIPIPRLMYTPEAMLVDLVYPDTSFNRNNVASTFLSWRYRATSIFDPDPALGSGSVPGYSYYAGGYNAYLVIGIGFDISLANMEASPVDIIVWPSVLDLGLNYAATNEMFGNPHAAQNTISAKGGMDRARLKGYIDLGSFYGNTTQYISGYGSTFGTNGATIYLNVGGVSATAFTATNGLDVRVTLTYRTVVFSRLTKIN